MSLSKPVRDIFCTYPQWESQVKQAATLPPFKFDYIPDVVEVFDQHGLLAGIAWGEAYETQRNKKQSTEFVAWFLDGQLGLFYTKGEIIVNRLNLMSAASILLSLVEV